MDGSVVHAENFLHQAAALSMIGFTEIDPHDGDIAVHVQLSKVPCNEGAGECRDQTEAPRKGHVYESLGRCALLGKQKRLHLEGRERCEAAEEAGEDAGSQIWADDEPLQRFDEQKPHHESRKTSPLDSPVGFAMTTSLDPAYRIDYYS
jgi:hypothetical protein